MKLRFSKYLLLLALFTVAASFQGCHANKKHRCGDCPKWN